MAIQHRLNVTILVSIAALLIAASPASLGAARAVPCKWVRTLANITTFAECNFAGTKSEPEASARNFINTYLGDLRMKRGSTELAHIEMRRGLGSQHTRFQQILGGHPVYNAYVSVHQGVDGRIRRLHTSYKPDQRILGAAQAVITRASRVYRPSGGWRKGGDRRSRVKAAFAFGEIDLVSASRWPIDSGLGIDDLYGSPLGGFSHDSGCPYRRGMGAGKPHRLL
jgi:hypothetical protein